VINNLRDLLEATLEAKSNREIEQILADIGDHKEIGLGEPFGRLDLQWQPFGNNLSNISTIGLAQKPGRSITERLTNAMDALLEFRRLTAIDEPATPTMAAAQWYGRPPSGPDNGLFKWDYSEKNHDRQIAVVVHSSGIETAPTIDVVDRGVGLTSAQFPRTILTLQGGNKIQKPFLIGSFGQGGASALGFCDYAMIASTHKEYPEEVAFTIIRVLELPKPYKDDCYAYLCVSHGRKESIVPSCKLGDRLAPYASYNEVRLPDLDHGTIVRHYSYKLQRLSQTFQASPGNLYHFLHCSLFDPLFPFRLIDLRESRNPKNEVVSGSRNRLMRLVRDAKSEENQAETGSKLRHYRPMEYVVPLGLHEPCIGIEYWVVLNYRKGSGSKKQKITLRAHSNELFVQKGHPVVATMNGQNQGELTARILRDIGLGMVARHCIIHMDATKVSNKARRDLFSTSREGFKEGPVLEDLMRVLGKMLKEDEELYEIERMLTERLIENEATKTRDEVKRNITRLLVEAGYSVQKEGPTDKEGSGEEQIVHKKRKRRGQIFTPLYTLPFPQVTKFEIVSPQSEMNIRLGDNELILVETDADAEFDTRTLIGIRWEPNCLELAAKAPLRGGRIRWRVRPQQTAQIGESGEITVSLTKLDGTQLADKVEFEILPPLEKKSKEAKGHAPPFEVVAIDPDNNPDKWSEVWDSMPEDADPEVKASVAYKPLNIGGTIYIYYSKVFKPLARQLEKIKSGSKALAELFIMSYETWIGYHGILQISNSNEGDDEEKEQLLEEERVRVAKMQIKQAVEVAKLMSQSIHNQASKDE